MLRVCDSPTFCTAVRGIKQEQNERSNKVNLCLLHEHSCPLISRKYPDKHSCVHAPMMAPKQRAILAPTHLFIHPPNHQPIHLYIQPPLHPPLPIYPTPRRSSPTPMHLLQSSGIRSPTRDTVVHLITLQHERPWQQSRLKQRGVCPYFAFLWYHVSFLQQQLSPQHQPRGLTHVPHPQQTLRQLNHLPPF